MKQQTSQITFKTDVGNVSFIDSHYFAKTYKKNDFNRNSFFLPSAGEALADIYDRNSPVLRFGDGLPMRQNLTEKI